MDHVTSGMAVQSVIASIDMQTRSGTGLFGYDLFISFALGSPPRGTRNYASDLARRLREHDLTVFYSEEEALVGDQLDSTLKYALHRSRILVVIANCATLAEPGWVRMEVEEFRRAHPARPVIPINIGGALQATVDAESWLHFSDKIWLDESQEAADEGIVTDGVLQRLAAAPTAMRASKRWRWTVRLSFAVLLIATVTALWFAWAAKRNARLASAQRMLAEENAAQARTHAMRATANEQLAKRESSRAIAAEKDALDEADAARAAERKALSGRLAAESQLARKSDPRLALLWAREAWNREPTMESRRALYEALNEPIPIALEEPDPPTWLETVDYSADGRFIAAIGRNSLLYLWNAETRQAVTPPPYMSPIQAIAFSPDGHTLAALDEDGVLQFWDPSTSIASRKPLTHPELSKGWSLAWRPESRIIAAAGAASDSSARIVLWDAASGSPLDELLRPEVPRGERIETMSFAPDGRLLAANMSKTIQIWNFEQRQLQGSFIDANGPLSVFLHESFLAFSGSRSAVMLIDRSFLPFFRLKTSPWIYANGPAFVGHLSGVEALAYAPAARIVATGSYDQTIRLWRSSGVPIGMPLMAHHRRITGLAFTPDGHRLASVAFGDEVIEWWLNTGSNRFRMREEQQIESAGSASTSVNGQWLVILRDSMWLEWYDLRTSRKVAASRAKNSTGSLTVANDGTVAASSSDTATLYRRGAARAACSTGIRADTVAFSPDSRLFVTSTRDDPHLRLWRTEDCRAAGLIPSANHKRAITFSSDGRTLLILAFGSVRRWNIAARRFEQDIRIDWEPAVHIATQKSTIATAHHDGAIRLTRIDRNETPITLRGPHRHLTLERLAFSPDGLWLASVDSEGQAALWDLTTNQLIGTPIDTDQGFLIFVAFSADSRTLMTRGIHGPLKRWTLDADAWAAQACNVAQRNPTCAEWRRVLDTEPYRRTCPAFPPPADAARCGAR